MEREKERQVKEEATWLEGANDETLLTGMSGFEVKREPDDDASPFCKIENVVSESIRDDEDEDWNRVKKEAVVKSEREKAEEKKVRLARQRLSRWRAEARKAEEEAFKLADKDPDGRKREARLQRKKKRRKKKAGEEVIVGMEERTSSPEIPNSSRTSTSESESLRFELVKKKLRRAWMEENRSESQLASLLAKETVTSFRPKEADVDSSSSDKIYVIQVPGEGKRETVRRRRRLLSLLRRAQETPEQREERLAKQRGANQRIRDKQLLEKHETAEERTARLAMRRAMLDAGHPQERIAEAERELADKVRERMRGGDEDPSLATKRRQRFLARKREDSRRFREREKERRLEAGDHDQEKANRMERTRLWRGVASGRVTREACEARIAEMRAARSERRQEVLRLQLLDGSDEEEEKEDEDSSWSEERADSPPSHSNAGTNDSSDAGIQGEKLVFLVPVKQYISLTGKNVEQLPPVVAMPGAGGAENYIGSGGIASDVLPDNRVYPVGLSPSLAPIEAVEMIVPDLPETRDWPTLAVNYPPDAVEMVVSDLPETRELPTLAVNQQVEVKTEQVDFPGDSENHPSAWRGVNKPIVEVKTEPEDILGTPENHQWPEIVFKGQVVKVKTEPMDNY